MKSPEKIPVAPSAYTYPLLIKQLLHASIATAPNQEIVYADKVRHTYKDFHALPVLWKHSKRPASKSSISAPCEKNSLADPSFAG